MSYIALLLPPLLVFIVNQTIVSTYNLQLGALLIIVYIIFSLRKKPHPILTVFIVNTITLSLVLSSSGIYSLIFFLLFFVVFLVAFLLESKMAFVYFLGVVAFFIPQIIQVKSFENLIPLLALLLFTPIAYFFGKTIKDEEFLKNKLTSEEKEIDKLKNKYQ